MKSKLRHFFLLTFSTLVMAAGTYSHPDRGTPFDEVNREYTGEEKRNRIRIGLKNRNGSTRGGR